jgi:cytochrome c oxidase subunit 3
LSGAPIHTLDHPGRASSGGGSGGVFGRPGGEGPSGGDSPSLLGDAPRFGLWLFLGTASMLFIGFTSAYILRRASGDWRPLNAPPVLWLNTAVLFASSATLERSRRRLVGWDISAAQGWLAATGALGGLFVAGQLVAWQSLAASGVFLASNPHSSFFYLLTGVHVAHLLGGLVWFVAVFAKIRRLAYTPGEDGLRLFATYWHFLAVLWAYLLFLLFVY